MPIFYPRFRMQICAPSFGKLGPNLKGNLKKYHRTFARGAIAPYTEAFLIADTQKGWPRRRHIAKVMNGPVGSGSSIQKGRRS